MKLKHVFVFFTLLIGITNSVYSQNYVDTLNAARRASNNGQYRKALKYYKSAERIKPKDLDLSQEMGQTAYKAGDYETAKRCFDNLSSNSKSAKERSVHHTDAGISSLGSEDYKEAEEDFKRALRENPKNEKARQLLMEAKRKRKQKESQNPNQGEGDRNSGNGGDQQGEGQNGNQNNQGQNNQSGQGNQNSKNKGKNKPGNDDGQSNGEGNLQDKQTERRLDQLMKEEADARRRMNGNNGTSQNKHAEKDW